MTGAADGRSVETRRDDVIRRPLWLARSSTRRTFLGAIALSAVSASIGH